MKDNFFAKPEFIAIIAAMMGLTAISIDAVLPAFPQLSEAFNLPPERVNDIQQVVFVYMLGFATTQLVFGVLSDAFGRKVILCFGIGIYIFASIWILFIEQFHLLLVARFLQGVGLAAPRVLSLAVVRDVTSGRKMSQVMSYALMVFMTVPILAPFIGQLMLKTGYWHSIFLLFIVAGMSVMGWIFFRLPETLPPERRTPLNGKAIQRAILTCITHKPTMIYLTILAMVFAMVMVYIGQAEQIFQREVYMLGDRFPLVFALVCTGQVSASYLNSHLVMRLGTHKIVKISIYIMLLNSALALGLAAIYGGKPPLILFVLFLICHFFTHSLVMPNVNSLTLEPHSQIAGVASALVGSGMTVIGVLIANLIAGQFNGTVYPLTIGFFILAASIAILNRKVNDLTMGRS